MSLKLLTVITAVKNIISSGRQEAMARCINSVAGLSADHEHIICDGGSTDSTLEFLRRYASSSRKIRIVSKSDNGVYQAFNNGVNRAEGEWIYFLGSDDYLFSVRDMEYVLGVADRTDAEMVISPIRQSDGKCGFADMKDCGNILIIKPYSHQGIMMKKSLITRLGGFNENYRIASDFELCLKAHLANVKHLFVDKTYAYFSVGTGVSSDRVREREERLSITGNLLKVSYKGRRMLFAKQLLPFAVIAPLLVHSNAIIRRGACYALLRRMADFCGLIDERGGPKPFADRIKKIWRRDEIRS